MNRVSEAGALDYVNNANDDEIARIAIAVGQRIRELKRRRTLIQGSTTTRPPAPTDTGGGAKDALARTLMTDSTANSHG